MRFDVVVLSSGTETTLATFSHHFDPPPAGPDRFSAVPYEADAPGIAASTREGDQLFLRFTVTSPHPLGTRQYAPNGDGSNAKGRIPSIGRPR